MLEDHSTSQPSHQSETEAENKPEGKEPQLSTQRWAQLWEGLVRLGLGEVSLRVGTGLASIVLILLVIWVMGNFYLKGQSAKPAEAALGASLPTPTVTVALPAAVDPILEVSFTDGIKRLAQLHTVLPERPRFDVITYEVQQGDTLFDIADKFGLHPGTLLFGNYNTLADNPDLLTPGQKLNILPVDGMYYQWHAGDGLNGVAKFYGVKPEDIINWPGNHLDAKTIGDLTHPNIKVATWIIIPGGYREFITWSAPRITRANPAVAKIFGPGACGKVNDGPIGIGTFIWPTTEKYLSGYDYSPETNHWGIDIAGKLGNPIWASDNGVVVYSGWNDWGYGNVVVIDHGNGWQTLYAHMSVINVACGAYVYQGGTIGLMGSTGHSSGPHLHFEMMSDQYGRANPHNFLGK
jgi:murein DD-endopeptidase MepM/ murein hydrolase activator NlpD